ncbi:unnamed protein product [Boreogadus saida]
MQTNKRRVFMRLVGIPYGNMKQSSVFGEGGDSSSSVVVSRPFPWGASSKPGTVGCSGPAVSERRPPGSTLGRGEARQMGISGELAARQARACTYVRSLSQALCTAVCSAVGCSCLGPLLLCLMSHSEDLKLPRS